MLVNTTWPFHCLCYLNGISMGDQLRNKHIKKHLVPPIENQLRCELIIYVLL